jgi:hypothetical protein
MANAFYKVVYPDGSFYNHGGTKSEIQASVSNLMQERFPKNTRIFFYWGRLKEFQGFLHFKTKKNVLWVGPEG